MCSCIVFALIIFKRKGFSGVRASFLPGVFKNKYQKDDALRC
jgi:hypothetical protein